MSKKQVPEVVSREVQMADLRKKLLGNKKFAKVRGKDVSSLCDLVENIVDEKKSPTDFVKDWDDLSSTVRVVGEWMSGYRRDGWDYAYNHLRRAFEDDSYILPGETVPLDKTIPITVVMFDPKDILWLLGWIAAHPENETELPIFRNVYESIQKLQPLYANITEDMIWLLQLLPSIIRRDETIAKAWTQDIVRKKIGMTTQSGNPMHDWNFIMPEGWNKELYKRYATLLSGQFHAQFIDSVPIAFVFRGTQAETLGQFSREMQDRIASWQFDLPIALATSGNYMIGIHPEREHHRLSKEFPSLVSNGCTYEHGGVILCSDVQNIDFDLYPVITIKRVEDGIAPPTDFSFVLKGPKIYLKDVETSKTEGEESVTPVP